jgi:DNA-directed RNA polymerase I, II, and III subunit RPABC5
MMSIPVLCYTCGKVVGNKWEKYRDLLKSGLTENKACDELGLTRYCCRRMLIANVDMLEKLLQYPVMTTIAETRKENEKSSKKVDPRSFKEKIKNKPISKKNK